MRTFLFLSFATSLLFQTVATAEEYPSHYTEQSLWAEIQEWDRRVSQGTISYLQTRGRGSSKVRTRLEFLSDLKFRKKEESSADSPGALVVPERVYDGVDWLSLSPSTIIITPGKPEELRKGLYTVDVTPRPSFPTGRGLSTLKQSSVSINGQWATIKGIAEDNTVVSAEVDTLNHCLASKISRFDSRGHLLGVIHTKGSITGGSIAASSFYSSPYAKGSWKFLKADFSPPVISRFYPPFPEGPIIFDQRLGTPISIRKTTLGSLSKDQVLQIVQSELRKRGRTESRINQLGRIQTSINVLVLLLPFLLLGAWFCLKRSLRTVR
jgi:hypothetical protein